MNKSDAYTYYHNGVFKDNLAKTAYFDLMRRFNYPISDLLNTDAFWVCDFLQGCFDRLGMGGIFWINQQGIYGEMGGKQYQGEFLADKFGYLGHEIFVLPNQALPEHRHVGGEQGYGPKMESWHVRYGTVSFFGQYKSSTNDEMLISDLPESQRPWGYDQPWFKARYVTVREAGQLYHLNDPESWHFMRGGQQGAIVTEYATFHNQVAFSKPGMAFVSSGP